MLKNSGAQDIQGTISPPNLTIDEAPYAVILDELLANLSSLSLRNAPPENRMVQLSFIPTECYPAVTVNFTCSYPNAPSITAVLLWVKRDGSDQFERDFRFSRTVLSSSSDNFTVEFQRTLQLREIEEFTELAGLYKCQADTGAETANATVNVLCESCMSVYTCVYVYSYINLKLNIIIYIYIHNTHTHKGNNFIV